MGESHEKDHDDELPETSSESEQEENTLSEEDNTDRGNHNDPEQEEVTAEALLETPEEDASDASLLASSDASDDMPADDAFPAEEKLEEESDLLEEDPRIDAILATPRSTPASSSSEVSSVKKTSTELLEGHVKTLQMLMRKTRNAEQMPIFFEGGIWALCSICAIVLTALLFGALTPSSLHTYIPHVTVFASSSVILLCLALWIATEFRKPDEFEIARRIQAHDPSWRHDLVSAMEFGQALLQGTFGQGASQALARAHIKKTATRALNAAPDGHLAHVLPSRETRPALLALFGALFLLALPFGLQTKWSMDILTGASARVQAEATMAEQKRVLPVVGNINLTYNYPSYTGKTTVTEMMTSGHIDTLSGSEVTIQAYGLLPEAKQVELVFKFSDGKSRTVVMNKNGTSRLSAKLILTQAGSYTFRAIMPDGSTIHDGIERTITITPDRPPKVELLSHRGELEVSPKDVLELEYAVEDDFGITAVTRVHVFDAGSDTSSPEDATRTKVEDGAFKSSPRAHQGKITIPLLELGLQPKDTVRLYIESADNNTLTGPGIGKSDVLYLRVSSPEDKHFKNVAEQQEILDALIDSLANFSEAPIGERRPRADDTYFQVVDIDETPEQFSERYKALQKAHVEHGPVLIRMKKLIEKLQADPLMVKRNLLMFISLHELLQKTYDDGDRSMTSLQKAATANAMSVRQMSSLALYASRSEESLEKAVLQLDALLASQKMESVKAIAEEIKALKERLKELLKKYKETKDPELKKAIKREIQRLRQRMNELMKRMASQMRKLPQDHINMDAAKMQEMQDNTVKMQKSFQDIEKLLEQDDIDGALKALEDMTKNLDNLTQEMNESFDNAQPQRLSEFDKEMSKLMDEAEDVMQMQKTVEQETAELKEQLKKERDRQANQMLEKVSKDMLKRVKEQERDLNALEKQALQPHHRTAIDQAKKSLNELKENLQQKDVEGSLEKARKMLDEIEQMRFSMQMSLQFQGRNPRAKKRNQQTRNAMSKTVPMIGRGQKMVDELQEVMDEARMMKETSNNPGLKKLSERQGKVNERAQKLQKNIEKASKKYPVLDQKIKPSMRKAQGHMKDAGQSLKRRRMQRGLDSQRKALQELQQMKQSMKQAVQKQRQEQESDRGRKNSKEKVEIPGKDDRNAPGYRDAIKDTMKEERLPDYNKDIKSYFESLVK